MVQTCNWTCPTGCGCWRLGQFPGQLCCKFWAVWRSGSGWGEGVKALKAAAERTEGRTAAGGRQMSDLQKIWWKMTTTLRLKTLTDVSVKKKNLLFFFNFCALDSAIYSMFENGFFLIAHHMAGQMQIWSVAESTTGRAMPQQCHSVNNTVFPLKWMWRTFQVGSVCECVCYASKTFGFFQ